MKASRPAASNVVASPSITTLNADRTRPTLRASTASTRPPGTGRLLVRRITASMSASHHMLSAPDAPAPMAMNSVAASASTGWIAPGFCTAAATSPASAVNTTRNITRGFNSAT